MKDNNYYTIQGWMRNKLKLKGNELIAYAIIYGFSQDSESVFSGSIKYISECIGTSKVATFAILHRLTEKELLIKIDKTANGVKIVNYRINENFIPSKETLSGSKESLLGSKETLSGGKETLLPPSKETLPNNNNNIFNDINNNIIDIKNKNISIFEKSDKSTSGSKRKKQTTSRDRPNVEPYGEFKNVYLTKDEVEKLIKKYEWYFKDAIELLSSYLAMHEDKYKNHYAVLCENNWVWTKVHANDDCGIPSSKIIEDDSAPGKIRHETPREYYIRKNYVNL